MDFIPVCEPYLNGRELEYVTDAVRTGWISSSGKYVTAFEEKFAAYCGVAHGVAVCNGTIALHLALLALGVGKGDEVILPTFTMIASAFAVCYTGAKPVFVDADPDTWNIDVTKIEEKITPRTKVIMPVHIFGKMCEMDAIRALAEKYGLMVLEDAAEAHGAEYHGRKAGACSEVSAFSFFANKNITTGEGGMVLTDNKAFFDIGYNYRMSNVVAAIGLAQVEKADEYRAMRIRNHQLYRKFLSDVPGVRFQAPPAPDCVDVCWMNTIVVDPAVYGHGKDDLIAHLKEQGIDTRLLFTGMHRQKAMRDFGCDCSGDYPVCDWLTENGFYLPSGSNLQEAQIERICDVIRKFANV